MRTPAVTGLLLSAEAHICKAAFNQKTLEEAFYDILNVKQGTFVSQPEDVQPVKPGNHDEYHFSAYRGCRRMDEEAMGVSQ
jgi:hypothetical protein